VLDGKFRVYEDGSLYRITNNGDVPAKTQLHGHKGNPTKKYVYVCFRNGGKVKGVPVHRIVAMAFIPNPNCYPCVNHIDGNTENNSKDNLEWVTYSMNINHAYSTGLIDRYSQGKKCTSCGRSLLNNTNGAMCSRCTGERFGVSFNENEDERTSRYQLVLALHNKGFSYKEIGDVMCISKQSVGRILNHTFLTL
jgi:hypothetical protein